MYDNHGHQDADSLGVRLRDSVVVPDGISTIKLDVPVSVAWVRPYFN